MVRPRSAARFLAAGRCPPAARVVPPDSRFAALAAVGIGLALASAGCGGYHLGPTNPELTRGKTIGVQFFENRTIEPRLPEALNHALRKQLQQSARLVRTAIDLAAMAGASPADGAVCLFVGVVRNENRGREVLRLEYEAYEEMALPLMEEIAAETARRFPVTDVRLVHRLGRLEIGEASVAVAVASPHRKEAFEACRFAIDTLKKTVPIWNKERIEGGETWLEGPGHPQAED